MSKRERSFLSNSLNFHFPQNWEELEGLELDLIIFFFLLKLPKYSYIFSHLF